jgi:nucleotide-binding universal stress UspA family protein
MPQLTHILLPTDFSPRAAIVARYATAMARQFQSKITMLHVLPPVNSAWCIEGYTPLMEEVIEHQNKQAGEQLNRFLAQELRDFNVERVLTEGDPARAIVDCVSASGVDLVMMPTRGCGPFRRFILGSVTAKVLHDTHCPVWTSEHIEELCAGRRSTPEIIACAVDLEAEGATVLHWASELAASFHAQLVVAHAIPSLEGNPETYYLEGDLRRALVRDARTRIHRMLDGSESADAEICVEAGGVPKVIRSVTENSQADLLIIGRSAGKGMLGRLRTHYYAIIRESPCPVISI